MSFLEKNKETLLKHFPGLFEELISDNDDELPSENIIAEITPAGEPTLCIKGIYIHSPRDPVREGQRLCETIGAPNSPVVILGFGLGYAAQAAAVFGMPLVIVEKNKKIFLKALELRDFSAFFVNNRIIFVIGDNTEGIVNALAIASTLLPYDNAKETDKKTPPCVIRNKALISFDEQWYKSAEDRIRTWSMKDDVNTATHNRFGKRWVRNFLHNMNTIRDLPGVSYFEDIASVDNKNYNHRGTQSFTEENIEGKINLSLPVFLAAAGPSLDKIKPMLRDIYERCIVVAVDTSLRFFVKNGIQPDFVLVVDPQFWNSRHLDRCDDAQAMTVMIAESAVYPPVLSLPFKNKFLCGSLFPLGTFIEKQVDPKGRLAAGGSVATTAWDFARILGGNEIWISGLDLAFPDLKTHFRGARFEESSNSQSNRFNPGEKWVVRALRDGKPFKALSGGGGQVLTDQRLSLYRAWFENQFAKNPHVKNYSFFQEGLAITGLLQADKEKFLSLLNCRDEINRRIKNVFVKIENEFNNPQEKIKRSECYDNAVSALKRGLESIKETALAGKEITRRALRYPLNPSQQNNVIKELDEITRRLDKSDVKEVAGFLFPPVEEEKDEKNPFRAYLKSTQKLFFGLADAVDLYL